MEEENENNCGQISYLLEEFSACSVKGEQERPCSHCDSLHPEALELFKKAVEIYKTNTARHYETICIHSGRRTTESQYRLYKAFKLFQRHGRGNQRAPADPPSFSAHEYGVSIDIIKKNDLQNLKSALEQAGWLQKRTRGEEHHFDAIAIDSWDKIKNFKQSLFTKYQKIRPNTERLVDLEVEQETLVASIQETRNTIRRLERRKAQFGRAVDRLHAKLEDLEDTYEELDQDLDEAKRVSARARARYENFSYTYCPDGNSLPNCTSSAHQPYRDRYFRDRARLRADYENAERDVRNIETDVRRIEIDIDRVKSDIVDKERQLTDITQDLRDEREKMRDKNRRLSTVRRSASRLDTENQQTTTSIQSDIDRFIEDAKKAVHS